MAQACSSVADGAVSRFAHSRGSVHAGHRHAVRTRAMSPPSTPDPEVRSSRRAFIIIGASVTSLSSVVPTMRASAESAASVDELQRSLVAAYEVQDFTAALDALRQLRQLEPEELRWIEADATISTDRKDFTKALKAYDAAYELARGDAGAEARILNGRALAREGIYDWPNALTDYDEVLRLAETNGFAPDPYVLNSRGNVRGSLGRWNDAKDDYESAGDLFQNAKGFRNGASTTQRLDGAIYAYSNKALATAQLGDDAGALKQLEALKHIQLPMAEILRWNSPMWFLALVDTLQDHSAGICKAPPAPELRFLKELLRFRLTNNT